MANENPKISVSPNGDSITFNRLTDTTLVEHQEKILSLFPNAKAEVRSKKDGSKENMLVFSHVTVEIPGEIQNASKKSIASLSSDENKVSVYTIALEQYKVMARASYLSSVKEALGLPKGVGGITPSGRATKKYIGDGGTFDENGNPKNDAVFNIMGSVIKNVPLSFYMEKEGVK
jgi:hypothetical protein